MTSDGTPLENGDFIIPNYGTAWNFPIYMYVGDGRFKQMANASKYLYEDIKLNKDTGEYEIAFGERTGEMVIDRVVFPEGYEMNLWNTVRETGEN